MGMITPMPCLQENCHHVQVPVPLRPLLQLPRQQNQTWPLRCRQQTVAAITSHHVPPKRVPNHHLPKPLLRACQQDHDKAVWTSHQHRQSHSKMTVHKITFWHTLAQNNDHFIQIFALFNSNDTIVFKKIAHKFFYKNADYLSQFLTTSCSQTSSCLFPCHPCQYSLASRHIQ